MLYIIDETHPIYIDMASVQRRLSPVHEATIFNIKRKLWAGYYILYFDFMNWWQSSEKHLYVNIYHISLGSLVIPYHYQPDYCLDTYKKYLLEMSQTPFINARKAGNGFIKKIQTLEEKIWFENATYGFFQFALILGGLIWIHQTTPNHSKPEKQYVALSIQNFSSSEIDCILQCLVPGL